MKINNLQKLLLPLAIITGILLLTGCANNEAIEQCLSGHKYGFFGGLWHGFIAPFDFIGMLFDKDITMYAQNNNGGLYALGIPLRKWRMGIFREQRCQQGKNRPRAFSVTEIR